MKDDATRIAELEAEVRVLRARVAELEAKAAGRPASAEVSFDEAFIGSLGRATIGWNLEGLVTRWSEEAARLLGYSRQQALGMLITDLMGTHKRTPEELRQWADRMMSQPTATMRAQYMTSDGRALQVQWSHTVLCDAEGQPTEVLSEVEDVTDQQATERALRDSQRLLLAVLDNTPSYVFVKDMQGRFLLVNRQVEAYLGKSRAEIAGLTDYDIFSRDVAAFFHRQDEEALRTGRAMQYEQTLPSPDGPLSYLALKFPVLDAQANPMAIAVICTDITERRRAEEEQALLRDQVIEAQKAALRELSTPLMPLAEGVVALPLVGAIDAQRAEEIMDTLLDGVNRYGAHTAILDVTGVRNMDIDVAGALVRAARAAELLGARVVITGIRGELAQTLVHLGEGFGGLTTRSTLRAGIAWALRR
ncbi:PAS domain S-box protein [Polyangium jinanense]|uniref:PAS domain S-box protein n=1 Tax=Polyangium jinanense TaxID=2829994 RepID=A0A9X3WYF7_9BACT|nr:PAS domain S-box protein [Polyangium jinanense]MDC3953019.1 PAS domain S-box protein [Polyangium jinanense]MDC3980637.1 PAS domain S-box protein [Polyangium jinanense]